MENPLKDAAGLVASQLEEGATYKAEDAGWSLTAKLIDGRYVVSGSYEGPAPQHPGPFMVGGGLVKRGGFLADNGGGPVYWGDVFGSAPTPDALIDLMGRAAPLGNWAPEE